MNTEKDTVVIEIVHGVDGDSVSLDDYRIAGPKPWGGGSVVKTFLANRIDILRALKITETKK